jgi:hypothetical protein
MCVLTVYVTVKLHICFVLKLQNENSTVAQLPLLLLIFKQL